MWGCVQVKEETPWEGTSSAAAREGLYAGHEVKQELLAGPEVLQPQDIGYWLRPNIDLEVTVVKEEISDVETNDMERNAEEQSGESSSERKRREITKNRQQLMLRPCTVQLKRVPVSKKQHLLNISKTRHKIGPKIKANNAHFDSVTDKNDLTSDMQVSGERFTCDYCGSLFSLRKSIIRNLQTCSMQASEAKHKVVTALSHSLCEKPFKSRLNLIKHEQSHIRFKLYRCEICDKRYFQSSHLSRHKRTHVSQPRVLENYACDTCSKSYKSKYDLFIHMRVHTGQMPYICQSCGKRFNKKSTLMNHEKTHAENRPYCCEVCKKQFAIKWNLTKHKRSHTNETPYSCNVCDKRFMHSYSLTKHKRKHCSD